MKDLIAGGALAALLLLPGLAGAAGTLSGTVALAGGEAPAPARKEMSDECIEKNGGEQEHDQGIVVNDDGSLRNVFVYISKGLEGQDFPTPPRPVVIDERGCTYRPHVVGLMPGQPLKVTNTDRMLDNLHSYPEVNRPINVTVLAFQREVVVREGFDEPEVMIPLRCDVHRWQEAWIGVVAHPFFAVTGDGGSYALHDLPAGAYTVTAWHEELGTQSLQVTIADGASAAADFTFSLEALEAD